MRRAIPLLRRFLRDSAGATAAEYGLLLAVLSLVVIGGVTIVGTALNSRFISLAGKFAGS